MQTMINEALIRKSAPAVFATAPAEHTSASYQFLPTFEVIDAFEAQGWTAVSARQVKARKRSPDAAKHIVSLRHESWGNQAREIGTLLPNLNLVNSHDWSSRIEIMLGIFRVVCGNGMMVSTGTFGAISVRHDMPIGESIAELTNRFGTMATRMLETSEAWDRISLSRPRQIELAQAARNLRFGAESSVDPVALLETRRHDDEGDSLWRTFNRIQENVTKGGLRFSGMKRRSREIKNISKEVEVNQGLWAFAEAVAAGA